MHNYSNELSSHLKRLRTDSGLTLEELSHLSGVSRATLSRIEKAETSPTAETLGNLNAHQKISYDKPSLAGQEHHLVVLQGDLYLEIENEEVYLSTGDCVRYKLYGSSVFLTKESSAKYIIALSLRK